MSAAARVPRGRRAAIHLPVLGLWTIGMALFFAPLLIGTAHIANGDFSGQFHAFGLFQMRELAAGRFPLWSPGSFSGFPFAADPQSAAFYPPRWITMLLSLPWRFPYYALQLEAVAHVWLAGAFTYLLAYDMTGRRAAALLAAVAFGLGGYLTSYPILQLAILETIAWLPLALLLLRRAVVHGRGALLAAAGLALGLSALAGHPQTLLHVAYAAAAYYLFLVWRARWRWPAVVKGGLLFAGVGLGLSAAALLPAARYVAATSRADVSYAFVSTGFPLIDYLQTVAPGALTLWSPQYVGLVALVFAALALFGRHRAPAADPAPAAGVARSEIAFWAITALLGAWLSLGDNGILFQLAYRLAPGFSLFRQQERLVGLFSLAVALLAAQGMALWLRDDERERPRLSGAEGRALLLAGGLLLLAGITLAAMREQVDGGWRLVWLRQWALLVPPAILLWAGWRRSGAAAFVVLLLAVDLFFAVRPADVMAAGPPSVFWPRPAWLDPLLDDPGRLDSQNLFHANLGEIYDLQDIRGISPLKPAAVARYEELPRRLRWQLLNVTHVLAREPLEAGLTPVASISESIIPGETQAATVYRFDDARPRAWLSYEPVIAPDNAAALAAIQSPEFDPARQVMLLPDAAPSAATVASGQGAVSVTPQPRGHDIAVETDAPAILVISEFALNGWRATVDGVAQPLLEANAGLMALPIAAGSHAVTLRYRPLDVPIGAAVSLLTLAAAVALLRRPIALERHAIRSDAFAAPAKTRPAAVAPRLRQGIVRPALVAILLLGFGLRVYRIGEQELRGDEAFSYVFTQLETAEVVPELITQGDPHPPLHYLLLNVWTDMAGDSELALRYPSAAAGALLLAALYALGRRMGGPLTGLAAAGLAAVSPGLIWLSQDTRNQYALVMLFTALATLILVSPREPGRRAVSRWAFYLAACVLTAYTHYYGAFALAAHGLYLWLAPGRRRDLLPWAAAGLLAAALLGLWLVPATQNVLAAGQMADPSQPELARHLTAIGRDLVSGQSLDGGAGRWLFLGVAALAAGGGVALARSGRREWAAMLAGWVLLGSYAIFLVRFSRGTFNSFYGSIVAPAWWLLIAAGLVALWQFGGRRRVAAVLSAVVLVGAMVVSLGNYYFDPQAGRSLGYRQVAGHLSEAAGADDVLIVPFPDPGWNYYLRHSSLPRRMLPATLGESAAETEATLAHLAEEHDRLWFIPYSGWDAENVAGRWLDYHTLSEERTAEGRMELRAYRPRRVAAEAMTAVDAQLGDTLRLAAAHVTVDGRAVELDEIVGAAPGSSVEVTLLWEGLRPSERSYTVFVHLRDANGAVIAQHDGIPASGTRPTPTWNAGETLLDRHELVLPDGATGPATLVVGLYDTATLIPQPFDGGLAAVPLGAFLIAP